MRTYIKPEMTLCAFDAEDIIRTSGDRVGMALDEIYDVTGEGANINFANGADITINPFN